MDREVVLGRLDIRLHNPIPRIFIILPSLNKSRLHRHPKDWLRGHRRTSYCLYFLCIHSMKAIQPPVPIIVTKGWLESVAPVLAMSLYLLHVGLQPGESFDLDCRENLVTLTFSRTWIAEMLEAVSEILTVTDSSDVLDRLRRNEDLDAGDVLVLNGDVYELIVKMRVKNKAGETK